MLFTYHAIDQDGHERDGTIEAPSQDIAVLALQRRNLIISEISSTEGKGKGLSMNIEIPFFNGVSNKEIVILSRQIATLFEAQVSALRVFRLLGGEVDNRKLAEALSSVGDDLQSGSPISKALAGHPDIFSAFYVNMVKAGEETGHLPETFNYLADYLDRSYDVVSKVENALIYPAFVVVVFFAVMWLMLTLVIPQISTVLTQTGQQVPVFTAIIISFSNFLVHYSIFILAAIAAAAFYAWQLSKSKAGQIVLDSFKLTVPYIGDLYNKLYLARIADNLSTMILSGISMVEAIDITARVIDNSVYEQILIDVATSVKGGSSISDALAKHNEMPSIIVAMTRVGEETGELGKILTMLAKFYNREITNAVDTLVGLIEPIMIVALGLSVGILLSAVLIPIYNLAGAM